MSAERPILTLRRQRAPKPPTPAADGRYVAALRLRSELAERFPLAFAAPSAPPPWRALAIGIRGELVRRLPAVPKAQIRVALKIYCTSRPYLAGLVAGAPRIDLDGNAVGAVSEEHAVRAKLALARRATP